MRSLLVLQIFGCFFLSPWIKYALGKHCVFQIKHWFSVAGEKLLIPLETIALSADKIKEMRENLDQFLEESVVKNKKQNFRNSRKKIVLNVSNRNRCSNSTNRDMVYSW